MTPRKVQEIIFLVISSFLLSFAFSSSNEFSTYLGGNIQVPVELSDFQTTE